jgi:hypothetical protein
MQIDHVILVLLDRKGGNVRTDPIYRVVPQRRYRKGSVNAVKISCIGIVFGFHEINGTGVYLDTIGKDGHGHAGMRFPPTIQMNIDDGVMFRKIDIGITSCQHDCCHYDHKHNDDNSDGHADLTFSPR